MKSITLTAKQTQVLFLTLEQLVNDDSKRSYSGNSNNPEWRRSAACSEYRVKLLRQIMWKLPDHVTIEDSDENV